MWNKLPYHYAEKFAYLLYVYNGLLCLCDRSNDRITLSNPAIKEFRILPECNENLPHKFYTFSNNLGFGFDPLSNDYKVIYIRTYMDEEKGRQGADHYAVYKMSTDSWSILEYEDFQSSESLGLYPNKINACVNGVYYWRTKQKIIAFYLGNEFFQLLESPCGESFGRLIPLHDCISLWDTEMIERRFRSNEVWVLNDEVHWTKLLKIEPILEVDRICGFWTNGKLLVESVTGQLLLYDIENEEFNELGIKAIERKDLLEVHNYEESPFKIKRN